MFAEFINQYGAVILYAIVTAIGGYLGIIAKKLITKYINDKTKEAVVRTCVKAAEQLYHDLSGAEKLEKAKAGVLEMLKEKGIHISELELSMLIESCVAEFNYGFGLKDLKAVNKTEPEPALRIAEEPHDERELVYNEEGGSR